MNTANVPSIQMTMSTCGIMYATSDVNKVSVRVAMLLIAQNAASTSTLASQTTKTIFSKPPAQAHVPPKCMAIMQTPQIQYALIVMISVQLVPVLP
jgi:hypothetical protein